MSNFIVSKQEDIFDAVAMIAKRDLNIKDIKISENFTIVVKVDDPKWGDSEYLDYRKASVILKLQEDILSIYNNINKEKISIKDLNENEDLVIKIRVENGCIQYAFKFLDLYEKITKNMTGDQQFICFLSLSGVLFSSVMAWAGVSLYKKYKNTQIELKKLELEHKLKEIESKEKNRILDSLDKSLMALSKKQTTASYIAENMSGRGMVSIGDEEMVQRNLIPRLPDLPEDEPLKEITMEIDGTFPIKKYDFETQNVQIALGTRSAWFSTKHMRDEEKEKIKGIADRSISLGCALRESLQITATKSEDNKISGIILAIGEPRKSAVSYRELLSAKFDDPNVHEKVIPLPIDAP